MGNGMRRRGGLLGELGLAVLPTLTVLGVVFLLEATRHAHVLFASLASSAFLVYRDPLHPVNSVRVMAGSHLIAVALGVGAAALFGAGYTASALAMVGTILATVLLNLVHPPAISTALGFAFAAGQGGAVGLFVVALGMVAALVLMQRVAVRAVHRLDAQLAAGRATRRAAKGATPE